MPYRNAPLVKQPEFSFIERQMISGNAFARGFGACMLIACIVGKAMRIVLRFVVFIGAMVALYFGNVFLLKWLFSLDSINAGLLAYLAGVPLLVGELFLFATIDQAYGEEKKALLKSIQSKKLSRHESPSP